MQVCPACAQENPDGFRLCGMCGASLTAAAPTAREERKVVTVLFTDLVGFTSRAEKLDPEDVRATLSPYYSRLRAEIERFGGTVEKFIGDAVMAVFGAPVAHEDDPERAVRAALAIREAVGDDLQIRTAVNTGEALVALGARPSEGEGMVSGDVVNTAARLQSAAPVGGILVGEATMRATSQAIEYRDAPPVDAKGKSEPVRVWEVVGARSRFGLDVEEERRGPLIGRTRERGVLADALAHCRAEHTTQLVTLVGVPGIGKTRLVTELFQMVDADPELITWRQGRSLPYGESLSYWALGEIVKSHVGILESDSAGEADAKLAAALADLFDDAGERSWVEGHVRPLVGLLAADDFSGDNRIEAFSAWRRLIEAVADRGPLVLVFEDLHWADNGLLDFVDHLADWAGGVPLLLVATARPELLDRRSNWGGGKRNASTLSIGSLSDTEVAQLLASLLERALMSADVQTEVIRRADGNPLYAEEYVRMLDDGGTIGQTLPETVQGMIAARLDTLPPEEKELVQDAAVIGKVFWPASLASLGERTVATFDDSLHALERKEFIRRDRRSAVAGELQFAFLHALVRDVAYAQIPRARRAEKHRLAAEWIESLAPDRSDDRVEMLAHHYREALALAQAAGVDVEHLRAPAKRAFADAAERALALNAWAASRDFAKQALELAEPDDALRPDLQLLIAEAGTSIGDIDNELVQEALAGFLARDDPERAAEAESMLSWMAGYSGGHRGDHAERAVELVQGRPPSRSKARAYAQLARVESLAGLSAESIAHGRVALQMAEELGSEQLAAHALNSIGMSRVYLGDDAGIDDLHESIKRAERANSVDELTRGWNNLMNLFWGLGRLDEGSRCWQAGYDASVRHGATTSIDWFRGEAMLDHRLRGDLKTALRLAEALLKEDAPSTRYQIAPALGLRANIFSARGRHAEALADSEHALERARTVADPQQLVPAIVGRVLTTLAAGQRDEANALLDELFNEHGLSHEEWVADLALIATELGRQADYLAAAARSPTHDAWREAGTAAAAGDLVEAAALFGKIGARYEEAYARLLAAERGAPAELEAAYAYFAEQELDVYIRRCEALLAASA